MLTAFEETARRAGLRGVQVRESEVVALLPEAALADVVRRAPAAYGLSQQQVLESRVLGLLTFG